VVVLPVHDEQATLAAVVARVPELVGGHPVEVVVVDDGSTDASVAEAIRCGATVVSHGVNRGLGAAVRTGFDVARDRGAVACAFLDADGEYDPAELPLLFEPVEQGRADYVVGSRFGGRIESMLPHRRVGNIALTILTSMLARRRLSDAQSGFRLLGTRALAVAEVAHDYNYAQVLTLELLGRGLSYAEVPITYRRRVVGKSFVRLVPYLRAVLPAMLAVSRETRQGGVQAAATNRCAASAGPSASVPVSSSSVSVPSGALARTVASVPGMKPFSPR
jgi:glycosyltransferase involved in cell wall biosynthesis